MDLTKVSKHKEEEVKGMKRHFFILGLITAIIFSTNIRAEDSWYNCNGAPNCTTASSYGTSVAYTVDNNNTMTIYGSSVPDYLSNKASFPEGVTSINFSGTVSIRRGAFANMPNLTNVDLTGVSYIDERVFTDCPNLKSIAISESLLNDAGNINTSRFMYGTFEGSEIDSLTIYCPQGKSCSGNFGGVSSPMVVSYLKDETTGVYQLGEGENATYYLSSTAMQAVDSEGNHTGSCGNLNSCLATVLKAKGKCDSEAVCLDLINKANSGLLMKDGKFYASIHDYLSGNHLPKRIYTVQEANEVAGKKNNVMIRYK